MKRANVENVIIRLGMQIKPSALNDTTVIKK